MHSSGGPVSLGLFLVLGLGSQGPQQGENVQGDFGMVRALAGPQVSSEDKTE